MTQPNDLSQEYCNKCGYLYRQRCECRIESPTPAEARGEVQPPGIDTANHAGVRVRGYTVEQYATLARQLAEAKEDIDGVRDELDFDRIRVTATQAAIAARATREFMCEEMTRFRARAEQAESQLAEANRRLVAVAGLADKWRRTARIDALQVKHVAPHHVATRARYCADELDAALQPKEPTHAPE